MATKRSGAERSGVERSGAEWSGVERSGAEWSGVERSGAEWSGVERKSELRKPELRHPFSREATVVRCSPSKPQLAAVSRLWSLCRGRRFNRTMMSLLRLFYIQTCQPSARPTLRTQNKTNRRTKPPAPCSGMQCLRRPIRVPLKPVLQIQCPLVYRCHPRPQSASHLQPSCRIPDGIALGAWTRCSSSAVCNDAGVPAFVSMHPKGCSAGVKACPCPDPGLSRPKRKETGT